MKPLRWPRFAAAALGFLWFLQVCGPSLLNPLNTAWLINGDWRQHWLGFLFFQREPWSFPLGTVSSLLYPIGTNIGFTDSNPLLSLLVKPFAAILPAEYQVIGLWFAACFALQGYAGAALAGAITKDPGQQLLGGYFFVLSPVLYARLSHDTLCAQWLVLALLYLGLREYTEQRQIRRAIWMAAAGVALAAAIHPYLAVMIWSLSVALMARLWRTTLLPPWRAALGAVLVTLVLLAVWGVIGYFGNRPDGSFGFGVYSADLLTLADPRGHSRLVPPLPSITTQWEGFGFLGIGGLFALGVGLVALTRRRPSHRRGVGIVAGLCAGLAVYALSSSVRLGGTEVLNLAWLYEPLMPLVKPFRSSGRFIWPLHYLLLAFGVWGVIRVFGRERSQLGTLLLAVVVGVQAADTNQARWWVTSKPERQINAANFDLARGSYRHMALAPMQVLNACVDTYDEPHIYRAMLLAHRLNLTFNSGIYSRIDASRIRRACADQQRAIASAALDPQTLYAVAPTELEVFKLAEAACGRWDGDWFCVSRTANPRFAEYLSTGKDPGPK